MSVFYCNGCHQYRDRDIHGCEEDTFDPKGYNCICEDCATDRMYDEEERLSELRNETPRMRVLTWH